jgi:type VI secretion system protein ImpE
MTATELFSAGRLRDAIEAQVNKVKAAPTDQPARLFLFELFAFAGDLDRARRHLDLLRYDDPQHSAAVEQLRSALEAERRRRAVFAGTEHPKCLGVAPDHLRLRLDALRSLASGEHVEARRRLDAANSDVPATTGTLNGEPFAGLYDADERFGTVLEVFGPGGVYSWVPLEQVESITLNLPQSPRDILWRPAHLSIVDGPEGDVLLPGLYPGTHEHADDEVKLGRVTEWVGNDGEVARGAGGRVFLTGNAVIRFVDATSLARTPR